MSFFKKLGKKSKGSSDENKIKNEKDRTAVSMSNSSQDEAFADHPEDEDIVLPPSFTRGRKDRNMSISRSGRHRYRNKQRGTVLKDEMYSTSNTSNINTSNDHNKSNQKCAVMNTSQQQQSSHISNGCREVDANRRLSDDHRVARATAV